jgi:hypothetical protein
VVTDVISYRNIRWFTWFFVNYNLFIYCTMQAILFAILIAIYFFGVADQRKSAIARDLQPKVDNKQVKEVGARKHIIYNILALLSISLVPQFVAFVKYSKGTSLVGDVGLSFSFLFIMVRDL